MQRFLYKAGALRRCEIVRFEPNGSTAAGAVVLDISDDWTAIHLVEDAKGGVTIWSNAKAALDDLCRRKADRLLVFYPRQMAA